MLTPYLPYPLYSGGQIRSYNLIKNLSDKHEITLFSFIRDENEEQYLPELRKYCYEVKVFLKRPPWSTMSLVLAAITFYPLVVCMYLRRKVQKAIKEAIERQHFNLIHAETFYVMPNIPKGKIPIILVEQTIEYLVYQHYTSDVKLYAKKLLMNWDVAKIHFWEKTFWNRASRVVAMSDADKQVMQTLVPNLTVDLVPNGVDTHFFSAHKVVKEKKEKTILFVGNFKWLQNREAVSILVKNIFPKIKAKLPFIKIWIVGRHPTAEIREFASDSVKVSDDIDDIRLAYERGDVLLAPIYGPGGTRYKILESMATGLPVVTTPTGIEGLDVKPGQEALIGVSSDELASETIKLLTSTNLYKKLSENGRKLVSRQYNWKKIAGKLDGIYQQAVYEKEY